MRASIVLDGGAYASSSTAVAANAATLGFGPYEIPNVTMDCLVAYTNNPPCGAMRGFGAVQACFAYESQMDKLAAGVRAVAGGAAAAQRDARGVGDADRAAGGLRRAGRRAAAPGARRPAAGRAGGRPRDVRELPGGVSNTTHGEGVVRGVGYAVGIKNVGFSEGFDDYSTARVQLELLGDTPVASVHTAAAEVGQGLVTLLQQIVRTELGVSQVTVLPADTSIGSAGSTSASRQSYVTGGAVRAACEAVRARLAERGGRLGDEPITETVQWRHRPTETLDPVTGQGNAHVQFAFAAHRAVVDVDTELGLVKVVQISTAQDVGKAMNPQAVLGQIHGGTAQGLGLAVMEEIQLHEGKLRNPSFTDYLLPTILDMPPMQVDVLELADPHAPYGLRGVGEPPTISSTPAIVAAIRDATGLALTRVPVRPEHITDPADGHARDAVIAAVRDHACPPASAPSIRPSSPSWARSSGIRSTTARSGSATPSAVPAGRTRSGSRGGERSSISGRPPSPPRGRIRRCWCTRRRTAGSPSTIRSPVPTWPIRWPARRPRPPPVAVPTATGPASRSGRMPPSRSPSRSSMACPRSWRTCAARPPVSWDADNIRSLDRAALGAARHPRRGQLTYSVPDRGEVSAGERTRHRLLQAEPCLNPEGESRSARPHRRPPLRVSGCSIGLTQDERYPGQRRCMVSGCRPTTSAVTVAR